MWYCGRTVTYCTLKHAAPIFASATPNVADDVNEQHASKQHNSAAIANWTGSLSVSPAS